MKPANLAPPARLQAILNDLNGAEFDAALNHESIARARTFIAGVKAYRHHPARRDVTEMPVIWHEGTTKLRDYNPQSPDAPIILVVPSIINRFEILDLDFAPSFLRTLAAAGFRPLVVDWDAPGKIETHFTLDNYIKRLTAITDWLGSLHKKSDPKLHLLGYCMGGLLALGLATLRPTNIQTLTLMATPWDFHQPDPASGILLAELAEAWNTALDVSGEMPVDIIQYLFALLQPLHTVMKFTDFAGMEQGSIEARQFVLVEDWLNDGVPLPVGVARECLQSWYGKNLAALFNWRAGGKIVDPRQVSMPSYVVVPGKDKIVPPESALPLAKLLPHSSLHEPMTGHIGMMASHNAPHQVWKPLLHWLDEHR